MTNDARIKLERSIVAALIDHLAAAGFSVFGVDDGEEPVKCSTKAEAMDTIFSVDEATLLVRKAGGRRRWVFLVLGNGEDVVSDYGCDEDDPDGFVAAMDSFDPEQVQPEAPGLKTEQNTREMGFRVVHASHRHRIGELHVFTEAFFEHGQWWVSCARCGASFSVVDAEGGDSVAGFDFEEVSEGDGLCLEEVSRERS